MFYMFLCFKYNCNKKNRGGACGRVRAYAMTRVRVARIVPTVQRSIPPPPHYTIPCTNVNYFLCYTKTFVHPIVQFCGRWYSLGWEAIERMSELDPRAIEAAAAWLEDEAALSLGLGAPGCAYGIDFNDGGSFCCQFNFCHECLAAVLVAAHRKAKGGGSVKDNVVSSSGLWHPGYDPQDGVKRLRDLGYCEVIVVYEDGLTLHTKPRQVFAPAPWCESMDDGLLKLLIERKRTGKKEAPHDPRP